MAEMSANGQLARYQSRDALAAAGNVTANSGVNLMQTHFAHREDVSLGEDLATLR